LRYLVEHAERLVTKETLFQVLWPETYVSDSVLMVCIRELRKALGDEARTPRFIETVHGRGYRFIAPLSTSQPPRQKANGKSRKSKISGVQHLTPSTQAEAEACFHKAIDIAHRQQAKSLELRATMSLARWWRRQGKR
jgi:DNA-binding winged helix-turn-helix (wHTH) protein